MYFSHARHQVDVRVGGSKGGSHSVSFYNACLNASKDKNIIATIPTNFDADETFTVTNVSIARIVNIKLPFVIIRVFG